MRILHFTFENFQDVPGLLSRSHAYFGDEGILATMTRSTRGFPNGILLDYPFLNSDFMRALRRFTGRENVNVLERELKLKIKGANTLHRLFLKARDVVWLYNIRRAWDVHELGDFDVYHFDGDVPFIYGDRLLKKIEEKHIAVHFFGSDLRKWGMNPYLQEYAQLKITSELDHTKIDPSLVFIPIPFEACRIEPRRQENRTLRVGHSPTRRTAKGTHDIIDAINRLKEKISFEFLLIEGVPHKKCMELKATCDIGIDQIGNYAGTGYGRSGLEFLALGIPTITEIPVEYEHLLPGHPFMKATKENFEVVLYNLLVDAKLRWQRREQGLRWVHDFPNPRRIMSKIYEQYKKLGWVQH